MNRTHLIQAFEQIATAEGYHFHTMEDRYIPQIVGKYPALWLSPPTFHSIEGRTHGKITYAVQAHAMQAAAKVPPAEHAQLHAQMEQQMMEIFGKLSQREFVVAVEDLQIRHSSMTLSSHGEVATTATAKVITFF